MALHEPIVDADVVIVGAGMAGLTAAAVLASTGNRLLLLDKGSGVGGRMATRRMGPGKADHGAQFFTARSPEFKQQVARWEQAGLVYPWSRGWANSLAQTQEEDSHVRYAAYNGMNALAKVLASELTCTNVTIETGVQVASASANRGDWNLSMTSGRIITARMVLFTAPVPQSLALLAAGEIELSPEDEVQLSHIQYAPCLCGLFWVEGEVQLPAAGALQRSDTVLTWIADNQRKGISPDARIITAHAGQEFSRVYYDYTDEKIVAMMQQELEPFLGSATVLEKQIKRWRYSIPTQPSDRRFHQLYANHTAYFAGDAFGGPRIEGAYLSGLAVGNQIKQALAAL
jgi:renalase